MEQQSLSYRDLSRLLAGRSAVKTACPWCGPNRYSLANRRKRTMKVWGGAGQAGTLITFNCARCGEKGFMQPSSNDHPVKIRPEPPHDMEAQYKRVNKLFEKVKPLVYHSPTEKYIISRGLAPVLGWVLPFLGGAYFKRSDGTSGYAMVAGFCDAAGRLTTLQYTTLNEDGVKTPYRNQNGRLLLAHARCPQGGAVRLAPLAGEVMGIAEGVETALSATMLFGVPTWAALSATHVPGFVPPPMIKRLIIFADQDAAGERAALRLRDNLCGKVEIQIRFPEGHYGDWNDVLKAEGQNGITGQIRPSLRLIG